jgi:Family of unknown function (DUF5681)
MRNKARKQQNGEVGYKRPPKKFQFKKGKSGNPSGGKRDAAGSPVADLRLLLQLALNSRVRHGEREDLMTHAAAGIEQLVAQFAAGDRHARRDLIVLAEKLGVELTADYGAIQQVVTAALAAEDEAIIADFLRRHGVEPEQDGHTDSTPDAETHRKAAEESSS